MDNSPPEQPRSAVEKAKENFARTPEEQWQLELAGSDEKQMAGAALALGKLAAAEGNLEEAVELLSRASSSEVWTVAPRALVQLAPVLERLGRQAEAEEALRDAQAHSDPEHTPDVILDVAAILAARDQPDRAIHVLTEVVEAWTRNERAVDDGAGLARAVAALRLGNLQNARIGTSSAIEAWELAVSANLPAVTPEAALRLANAFVSESRGGRGRPPAEIEELYRVAIDFDHPKASPEAALKLGEFYMRQEQPQLAAREYEQLIPVGGRLGEQAEVGLERARAQLDPDRSTPERVWQGIKSRASGSKGVAKPIVIGKVKATGRSRDFAVIVGAGTGGKYLLRDLDRERHPVLGWIDDGQKKGTRIGDLPVLGKIDDLPQLLTSSRISTLFIAVPTMPGVRRRKVVEAAMTAPHEVKVRNLPSMFELRRGGNLARQLRDVRVEETLGEQEMRIDREAGAVVRGRSVMITGAGGTIGSELSRQVAHARARYVSLVDPSTMALRRVAGDLERDREFEHVYPVLGVCDHLETMRLALATHRPEVVFHAAGHSYAPIVEEHPLEAMRTDVVGAWDFARLCGEAGVKRFVLISSEDAAEPNGVFSASKALAEHALRVVARDQTETDFVAVRVGNLYRSSGSVVEVFEHQIATGGPVTLTEQHASRRFMRVELATQLLLRTAGMAKRGGLYALKGTEEVLIKDLAEWMIRLHGYEIEDIGIEITGRRRGEKSLGSPYGGLERPITTDIPDVLEIAPSPDLPLEAIVKVLTSVKQAVAGGDPADLYHLVEKKVQHLLNPEPRAPQKETEKGGSEPVPEDDSELVPW